MKTISVFEMISYAQLDWSSEEREAETMIITVFNATMNKIKMFHKLLLAIYSKKKYLLQKFLNESQNL